jgi:uncharacterized coiled-coil protein SlyX
MGLFDWLNQQKRIGELEDTVAKLWSLVEKKDMDWADLRARCKRLLDRDEKAVRALNRATPEVESEVSTGSGEPGNGDALRTHPGRLSDHQREIQQQILRRRAGI